MDNWPFWLLEENISIVNEITEEENDKQKEEQNQTQMPNFDTSKYMSQMNDITNKFKNPL